MLIKKRRDFRLLNNIKPAGAFNLLGELEASGSQRQHSFGFPIVKIP